MRVNWSALPVYLTGKHLMRLGLTRTQAYDLIGKRGEQVGKRMVISKTRFQQWFNENMQ